MRSAQKILKEFNEQRGNDEAKHIKERLLLEAILNIRDALWEPYRKIEGKIPDTVNPKDFQVIGKY